MKRSKLSLVVVVIMLLSTLFACTHFHAMGEWFIDVDPTLESEGVYVQQCEGCGERVELAIPALSDESVWTLTETVEPDHHNLGKKVYNSTYGEVVVELPLVPHVYGEYTLTVNPTLTETGKATHACECEYVEEVEVPVLTDEAWSVVVDEADHFETGLATYTSVYGTVEVVLEVIPHSYGAYTLTQAPTLTETGKATHACECEYVEEVEVPVLTNEAWTLNVTPSTHKEKGVEVYTSVYGVVEIELPLVPHDYGEFSWAVEPSFANSGKAVRSCACGDSEEVEVPALTDSIIWTVEHTVAPTYEKEGLDTYSCAYGKVEIVVMSLVAPYDGKTYHVINFDADEEGWKNGPITPDTVWKAAEITLDQVGSGAGVAYPFKGAYKFIMVNAETGEIRIESYAQKTEDVFVQDPESWDPEEGTWESRPVVDEDGNPVYDWENAVSSYTAWVDFASGLILAPRNNTYDNVNLYTPFDAELTNVTAVSSAWDGAIAIEYTFDGVTYSILVYNDRAYFGVSFVDLSGNAIAANECYNAQNVKVLAKDGSVIAGFAKDAESGKLVVSDGFEGVYTNASDTLALSGAGVATLNGVAGTYVINENNIGVYANGEYTEVVLDGTSFTAVKPMVTISFDGGEYATVNAIETNKNIAIELPVPTHEMYTFKGWTYNGEPVAVPYIPAESVTLVATWKAKVVINLSGVIAGDNDVLYLGVGDVIGDFLPAYGVNVEIGKVFRGWYLDAGFETALPEDAEVSEEDNNILVYAKWDNLPAYYGTYYGTELWNGGYGNSGNKTLTIDENGNMTGVATGVIVGYDPETQVVSWHRNNSSTIYTFYYNEELDVIAGIYNNYNIGNDFHFLSKNNPTNGKVNAFYGVKAPKTPNDTKIDSHQAHLINAETKLGTREIFLYNNYIYTNFTAVDGEGNPLTAATVKNSKILVVKDAEGKVIVSVASKGTSFANTQDTVKLDAYFGTYVNGEESVVLDGVGGITYGEKKGTYAVVEGADYFDVYFADPAEYYKLTLNGTSFEIVKPMVTITMIGGAYAEDASEALNVNIAYTLPVLEHATNVFNGWFYDEACTEPVGATIVPTADDTIYALWKVKATLTLVYNNGAEDGSIVYSVGDLAEIEAPKKTKMAFAGWYTTATFEEGTEWTSGSAVEGDLTIYAKWEEAPAFYNTYTITRFQDTNLNGKGYMYFYKSYSTGPYTFEIGPDGAGVGTNSPFNGNFTVENYNKETGYLEIHFGSSVYFGYLDSETGIIITEYVKDKGLNQVFFFNPLTTEELTSSNTNNSYWNYGLSRAIQYTYEGTTYSIFVHNNEVFFNVSFKTGEGTSLTAVECYTSSTVYVYGADDALIAKFAHDGTSLQTMDGFEGTYAAADGEIIVNGVKTITIGGVEGEYSKAEEGASYTHFAYVGDSYYEVTLTVADYTAVVVKPMVTVTYETYGKADIEAESVNKNIAHVLPVPENDGYVFRAWYLDAEFVNAVPAEFIPAENTTVYAKWAEKITLTVVYGNGIENAVLNYAQGDTAEPVVPPYTNGQAFAGWYADAECTVEYLPGVINETTVIYCAWVAKGPYTVVHTSSSSGYNFTYDAETGIWTNGNTGINSSKAAFKITAIDTITVSFQYFCSSEHAEKWDWLSIKKNGTQIYNAGGKVSEVVYSETVTITLEAGETLEFVYSKDGSSNGGLDKAMIKDLTISGELITTIDEE